MEREHILIISHSYTPFINPRSFRWASIAEYWAKLGFKIDVITSWLPGLSRFENINGVEVHRIGGGVMERLRAILRPKSRATTAEKAIEVAVSRPGLLSKISGWILAVAKFINDKIWRNVYWPDYACLWIAFASAKALELCSMEQYRTVISVSDPFSSHLAGKSVKTNHPEIKWLADIGDPFCFRHDNPANNHAFYGKLNHRKESQIFEMADAICVTTGMTCHKYAELFPHASIKIKVIPPLMTELVLSAGENRILPENKNTKLVYVGTLYRSIRNPEHLLKLFKSLLSTHGKMNVELHFFGGYDDCRDIFEPFQLLFADKLVLHGLVSRATVFRAMQEADILINIGNDNPYQLPSKLVEYTGMGKPIVNLHSIENDSSKEFLNEYPANLDVDTRPSSSLEEQVRKLADFINRLPISVSPEFLSNWRKHFSAETIADEYAKVILTREKVIMNALGTVQTEPH